MEEETRKALERFKNGDFTKAEIIQYMQTLPVEESIELGNEVSKYWMRGKTDDTHDTGTV
jgi:hypothetical protein